MTTRSWRSIPLFTAAWQPLMLLWVAGMISVPLTLWFIGDEGIPVMSLITTLLQFGVVLAILVHGWGIQRTASVFGLVAVITYLAEFIGSKTGIPFGSYHYTEALQPQLFGVPLIIPLAWFMMLGPAWAVAFTLLNGKIDTVSRRGMFIVLSGLAITAWDLFLDPQMVGWGFWVWHEPSGYFGIPWLNYFGWFLTAAVVTTVVRPDKLPLVPLIIVYGIVWVLQSIGLAVFWAQPGPALCGFIGMGIFLFPAVRQLRKAA